MVKKAIHLNMSRTVTFKITETFLENSDFSDYRKISSLKITCIV